jgi:hypothetical protein
VEFIVPTGSGAGFQIGGVEGKFVLNSWFRFLNDTSAMLALALATYLRFYHAQTLASVL